MIKRKKERFRGSMKGVIPDDGEVEVWVGKVWTKLVKLLN